MNAAARTVGANTVRTWDVLTINMAGFDVLTAQVS